MPAFIYTLPPVIINALAEERFPFPVLHTLAREGQVDATRGFELRAAVRKAIEREKMRRKRARYNKTLVDAMFELGDALIDLEAEVESFNCESPRCGRMLISVKRVIAGAVRLFAVVGPTSC